MQNISKGCKIILVLILSIVFLIKCGNSAPRKTKIDNATQKSKRNAGFMNYFNSMVYETSFNYPTYSWNSYAPSLPSYDYNFIQHPVDSSNNNLDGNFNTILSFDYNWPENDMKEIIPFGAVPENNNNDRALVLTNVGKDDSFTYFLENDYDYDLETGTNDLNWNFPPHGIDESIFNSFYLIPDHENPNRENIPQTTEKPTESPISNKIGNDQTPNISIFNCFSDPDQKKIVENVLSNKNDEYMVLLIKRNHFIGAKEDEKKTEIILTQPGNGQEELVDTANNFTTKVPEEEVLSKPNPVLVELDYDPKKTVEKEISVSTDSPPDVNLGQVSETSPVSTDSSPVVNQDHVIKPSVITIDSKLDVREEKVNKTLNSTPHEIQEKVTKTSNVSTNSRTDVIQEQVIKPLSVSTDFTPDLIQEEVTTSAVSTDSGTEVIQKHSSIPTEILTKKKEQNNFESSLGKEYNVSVVDIHQSAAKLLQNPLPIISETIIVKTTENPINIVPEREKNSKAINKPDEEVNTEIMTKNEVNLDLRTEATIILANSSLTSESIPTSTIVSVINDTLLEVDNVPERVSNIEKIISDNTLITEKNFKEINKPDEEVNTEIMTKNEVNLDLTTEPIINEFKIPQEIPVEVPEELPKQSSIDAEATIVLANSSLTSEGIPTSTVVSVINDTLLEVDNVPERVSNIEKIINDNILITENSPLPAVETVSITSTYPTIYEDRKKTHKNPFIDPIISPPKL